MSCQEEDMEVDSTDLIQFDSEQAENGDTKQVNASGGGTRVTTQGTASEDVNMDQTDQDHTNTLTGGNLQMNNPASAVIVKQPGPFKNTDQKDATTPGQGQADNDDEAKPATGTTQFNTSGWDTDANTEDIYTSDGRGATSSVDPNAQVNNSAMDTPVHNKKDHRTSSSKDNNEAKTSDTGAAVPSAPTDTAKIIIKVEFPKALPQRWKALLQKTLQTWCTGTLSKHVGEACNVVHLQLMLDQNYAEMEISPSKAVDVLKKMKKATLTFKDPKESATVHFLQDERKPVMELQTSLSTVKEKKVSLPKVDMLVTAFVDLDQWKPEVQTELIKKFEKHKVGNKLSFSGSFEDVERFYREVSEIVGEVKSGNDAVVLKNEPDGAEMSNSTLTVPLFQYWYFSHAYRKELNQIETDCDASINAEVSVSVTAQDQTRSDCVSEATQRFTDLLQKSLNDLKSVQIPPTQLKSEIVEEAVRNIQRDETKMVLNMSVDECRLFGPEKYLSSVEKQLNLKSGMEHATTYNDNAASKMETGHSDALSLEMDIKDTPDSVVMNKTHWDLMKETCDKQLHNIQNKYGVIIHLQPVQGSIKVTVQSIDDKPVNLESHARRAFIHLFQKVVMSAITCSVKVQRADVNTVIKALDEHRVVSLGEKDGIWKLIGLPQNLASAIADIEKQIGRPVFDDKTKQLIDYAGYSSQSIERTRGQHGANTAKWTQDASQSSSGARADDPRNAKDKNAKEKQSNESVEDNCPICMDTFTNKQKLKCGHEFCRDCLTQAIKSMGEICPVCKEIFGKLTGTQPVGKMTTHRASYPLPGYQNCGTIEIDYHIPNGIQKDIHPNPGKHFQGTSRRAYLPDNDEGRQVLKLLQRAFDQKLIFTVGISSTTGLQDCVTWNDIHHKTNIQGGPGCYGYPDPDYFKRVKEELKAKGIE